VAAAFRRFEVRIGSARRKKGKSTGDEYMSCVGKGGKKAYESSPNQRWSEGETGVDVWLLGRWARIGIKSQRLPTTMQPQVVYGLAEGKRRGRWAENKERRKASRQQQRDKENLKEVFKTQSKTRRYPQKRQRGMGISLKTKDDSFWKKNPDTQSMDKKKGEFLKRCEQWRKFLAFVQ